MAHHFAFLPALALLAPLAVAAEPARTVDPLVAASPYGNALVWSYAQADQPLPWTLFKPNDFAPTQGPFDGTGVRPVGSVPAPGIHPRLFFSAEDLPALRRRLRETASGRAAWRNLLCYAHALTLTYDEKADYAQPDLQQGKNRTHGPVALWRMGGYGPREDYFSLLAAGKAPAKTYPWYQAMTPEALRCLVEDDGAGARKVAAALMTALRLDAETWGDHARPSPEGYPPRFAAHPGRTGMSVRSENAAIGMLYDFIFPWMTPEQRTIVRESLVLRSAWEDNYGTFNNASSSRSNFATFSHSAIDALAIDGEPGANDLKLRGLYRGWRNFYSTSFFVSGAIFEGEGKSLLGLDACVGFTRCAARYGWDPLTWHPAPRRHFTRFLPQSVVPSRDGVVKFDLLGGIQGEVCKPEDVVVAHYLYPEDRSLDLAYRLVVGDAYERLPSRVDGPQNQVILSALFATDHDASATPESLGLPPTFFCGQRAMLMTRSGWDTDATFLTFHERGASGGHAYRDRNGIMLTGKGRPWITIPSEQGQENGWLCNTVQLAGSEPNAATPGRVVGLADEPQATFIVGDAKHVWDWSWTQVRGTQDGSPITQHDLDTGKPLDFGGAMQPVDLCFNDFAFTRIASAANDRPLRAMPDWINTDGLISPVLRMPNRPVLKAFRTAGVVRGPHPYVLVVDDFQRDALPATYHWNLTMVADVVAARDPLPGLLPTDLVVAGQASLAPDGTLRAGEPALLIRTLEARGQVTYPHLNLRETVPLRNRPGMATAPLVQMASVAPSPDFKVLLYAFRKGEPLPQTTTEAPGRFRIGFPDQTDVLTCTPASSGKTDLRITRQDTVLVDLHQPVPPLVDPASDALTAELRALPAQVERARAWDPGQIPGLVASWPLDRITADGLPADQPHLNAFPAAEARLEDTPLGTGVRFPLAGGRVAVPATGLVGDTVTISCWVRSDRKPNERLLEFGDVGLEVHGSLWVSALRQPRFVRLIAVDMLTDWTHYVVVVAGRRVTLYANGRQVFTKEGDRPYRPGSSVRLGEQFRGIFRDLRIYATALDADTVQRLYLRGAYPPPATP